jgi:hypothetical protein
MVGFETLKQLQVPWAFLVGFAEDMTRRFQYTLPKNLEHLTITDDLQPQNDSWMKPDWLQWEWTGETILCVLESWLRFTSYSTPHLQHRTLLFGWVDSDYNGWKSWSLEMKDRLQGAGARAGVQCEIIELDPERFDD